MEADRLPYFLAERIDRLVHVFIRVLREIVVFFRGLLDLRHVQTDVGDRRMVMPLQRSRTVFGKRTDPRAEFRAVTQFGKVHPGRNESILRSVLRGIAVPRHLVGRSHHCALMPAHERFIRVFHAKQRHLHKQLIVFVGILVHSVFSSFQGRSLIGAKKREKVGWYGKIFCCGTFLL